METSVLEQKNVLMLDHVIFLSTWGTGKTKLMVLKAHELAKEGQKVLFVIVTFGSITKRPTLLVYQLQNEFSQVENVKILHLPYIDGSDHGLVEIAKNYDHILIGQVSH